ncbi:MAG: hypothetical protein JSS70_05895, partial [Bacteroidetes bacterium]|nr:hypothetical protein [Bacteroidota bacterium]
ASLITSLSAPLVFQHGVSIISWEFFYILIERNNSETALAISNTMRNVFGLFGSYTWAFAAAASSMVSNIIGQGRQDEVQQLIWKIVKISTGISIIVFVILNVFPQLLLSIYGQPEEFIREAIPVVRVISVAMLLMSFSVIWVSSVTGTGNTKVSLMIEVMTIIFYCLFVFIVLEKLKLGIVYGWMSEWLYWTSLFIPSLIYIRSGRWRKKVI